MKPNYQDLGLSVSMGPKLRKEVELQLVRDLSYYHIFKKEFCFDWSESCIEGKCLNYLDGSIDRFSGIYIFDAEDQLIADGWMDFIFVNETNRLIVYWNFLDIYIKGIQTEIKSINGIPNHIKDLLTNNTNGL